jgi:hypothetical protein
MTFRLPILDILDEMQSKTRPDQTVLSEVITRLYVDEEMPAKVIATVLGIGEATVHSRIPAGMKRKELAQKDLEEIEGKVKAAYAEGKVPKEIAYDYALSLGKVYTILKQKKNK